MLKVIFGIAIGLILAPRIGFDGRMDQFRSGLETLTQAAAKQTIEVLRPLEKPVPAAQQSTPDSGAVNDGHAANQEPLAAESAGYDLAVSESNDANEPPLATPDNKLAALRSRIEVLLAGGRR